MVTSAGILVALVYYASVLRHQTTLRQTDLIMRLNSDWINWEIEKDVDTLYVHVRKYKNWDEWKKTHGSRPGERWNTPEVLAVSRVTRFFDIVGILLRRKLIDIGMVDEMFGYDVKLVWEAFAPVFLPGLREEPGMFGPTFRGGFEYLYNEMKKRE